MRRFHLTIFLLLALSIFMSGGAFSSRQEPRLSDAEMLDMLLRLADDGDADALYKLYFVYSGGFDTITPNFPKAIEMLRAGAEAGSSDAQNLLGYKLFSGDGMERDVDQALGWLEQSAGAGNLTAASNLGYLLLYGEGIVHDEENAAFWLRKAADGHLPAAQSMLGDLYRDGRGVEQSVAVADSLYRSAYSRRLADAAYKLADLHKAEYDSLPPSKLTAEALLFYNGGNPDIALPLLQKAADRGFPQAYALLGDAYTRGRGVAYDHQKALDCYARAAVTGFAPAMFFIGELLEIFPDALTTLSDDVRAMYDSLPSSADYWMKRAADDGVIDAAIANKRLLTPPQ